MRPSRAAICSFVITLIVPVASPAVIATVGSAVYTASVPYYIANSHHYVIIQGINPVDLGAPFFVNGLLEHDGYAVDTCNSGPRIGGIHWSAECFNAAGGLFTCFDAFGLYIGTTEFAFPNDVRLIQNARTLFCCDI